jgi:6-phosphogluconolactonase
MNLRVFDTLEELQRAVARTILQQNPRFVALSGGSSPRGLYTMLGAPPWLDELAQRDITWIVVDERYVPHDDPQSNARMIEETLFANGLQHRFLPFRTELNDPALTAARFEEEYRALGIEHLDVVLLGVGDDGHTASLFPNTPVLEAEGRIAAEVFVPRLDQWRVTITKPVIRAAKLRIVLTTGAAKAKILAEVREGVPHQVALATEGVETWWFVDRAAAEHLSLLR